MSDIVIADNDNNVNNMMVDLDITKQQMDAFHEFKKEILDKSDIAYISIGGVNRPLIKKSGWRKIQTACRLSHKIVDREITNTPEYTSAFYVIEVTAPAGRSGQGVGACDSREKSSSRQFHDIVSTAYTRALNRAISDIVGMGELVYEEIKGRPVEEMNPNGPAEKKAPLCFCDNRFVGKDGISCANCNMALTPVQAQMSIREGHTYEAFVTYCHCKSDERRIDAKTRSCTACKKALKPSLVKLLEASDPK